MKSLRIGRIGRIALLLLLSTVATLRADEQPPAAAPPHPRLQRAMKELETSRELFAGATNDIERAMWERRIELATKEVDNVRRLIALEERESRMNAEQQDRHARLALLDILRTVDMSVDKMQEDLGKLDAEIRQKKERRSDLAGLKLPEPTADDYADRFAEQEQKLNTADAEIMALLLERDALGLRLRVARDAVRIDATVRDDQADPRPRIRSIVEKHRLVREATKNADAYRLTATTLAQQREGTAEALALARERFNHLDEEIATLGRLYGMGRGSLFSFSQTDPVKLRRQQQLTAMLAEARSQKRNLDPLIEARSRQLAALDQGLQYSEQGAELSTRHATLLQREAGDLTERFARQVVVPGGLMLVLMVIGFLLNHVIYPRLLARETAFVARRVTAYLVFLCIAVILIVWFIEDLRAIATLLGIVGAAVVIALQDLCSAFAGWFVIMASRKVRVGDRVEIDGHRGDIVDIQLLRTTMLEVNNWLGVDEHTGRIMVIPNNYIFKDQVFNYSHVHPHIWCHLDVTITYESPPEEARRLLETILREETQADFATAVDEMHKLEKVYGLPIDEYRPKIYSSLGDWAVIFKLMFVCHYRKVGETKNRISRRILIELERNPHIQLAYPTQREFSATMAPPPPAPKAQG